MTSSLLFASVATLRELFEQNCRDAPIFQKNFSAKRGKTRCLSAVNLLWMVQICTAASKRNVPEERESHRKVMTSSNWQSEFLATQFLQSIDRIDPIILSKILHSPDKQILQILQNRAGFGEREKGDVDQKAEQPLTDDDALFAVGEKSQDVLFGKIVQRIAQLDERELFHLHSSMTLQVFKRKAFTSASSLL